MASLGHNELISDTVWGRHQTSQTVLIDSWWILYSFQSASPWSGLKDVLPDPEASYQIADFSSPQLEALVLENVRRDVMLPQMKALYEMMDRHWDTHYHKFKYALLKVGKHVLLIFDNVQGVAGKLPV